MENLPNAMDWYTNMTTVLAVEISDLGHYTRLVCLFIDSADQKQSQTYICGDQTNCTSSFWMTIRAPV